MAAQIRVQTSRWSKIADSHLERTPLFSIKHLFLRKPSQEHQIQDSCRSCMKSSSGGIFHSRLLACEIRVSFYARFPCDIYRHNVTFFVIAYLFPCQGPEALPDSLEPVMHRETKKACKALQHGFADLLILL